MIRFPDLLDAHKDDIDLEVIIKKDPHKEGLLFPFDRIVLPLYDVHKKIDPIRKDLEKGDMKSSKILEYDSILEPAEEAVKLMVQKSSYGQYPLIGAKVTDAGDLLDRAVEKYMETEPASLFEERENLKGLEEKSDKVIAKVISNLERISEGIVDVNGIARSRGIDVSDNGLYTAKDFLEKRDNTSALKKKIEDLKSDYRMLDLTKDGKILDKLLKKTRTENSFFKGMGRLASDCKENHFVEGYKELKGLFGEMKDAKANPDEYFAKKALLVIRNIELNKEIESVEDEDVRGLKIIKERSIDHSLNTIYTSEDFERYRSLTQAITDKASKIYENRLSDFKKEFSDLSLVKDYETMAKTAEAFGLIDEAKKIRFYKDDIGALKHIQKDICAIRKEISWLDGLDDVGIEDALKITNIDYDPKGYKLKSGEGNEKLKEYKFLAEKLSAKVRDVKDKYKANYAQGEHRDLEKSRKVFEIFGYENISENIGKIIDQRYEREKFQSIIDNDISDIIEDSSWIDNLTDISLSDARKLAGIRYDENKHDSADYKKASENLNRKVGDTIRMYSDILREGLEDDDNIEDTRKVLQIIGDSEGVMKAARLMDKRKYAREEKVVYREVNTALPKKPKEPKEPYTLLSYGMIKAGIAPTAECYEIESILSDNDIPSAEKMRKFITKVEGMEVSRPEVADYMSKISAAIKDSLVNPPPMADIDMTKKAYDTINNRLSETVKSPA